MWCIYREKNKGKKKGSVQRSCDRCKGEGRGGEGVANGHMTVGGGGAGWEGRGGKGGRGEGRGRGGGGEGKGGLGRGRGGGRPATLGTLGPPLLAHRALHSRPVRPSILGPPGQ